jgi:hypothetical protein
MELENILCQIHSDHHIFSHGCRPFRLVVLSTTILAHCDAVWGRPATTPSTMAEHVFGSARIALQSAWRVMAYMPDGSGTTADSSRIAFRRAWGHSLSYNRNLAAEQGAVGRLMAKIG